MSTARWSGLSTRKERGRSSERRWCVAFGTKQDFKMDELVTAPSPSRRRQTRLARLPGLADSTESRNLGGKECVQGGRAHRKGGALLLHPWHALLLLVLVLLLLLLLLQHVELAGVQAGERCPPPTFLIWHLRERHREEGGVRIEHSTHHYPLVWTRSQSRPSHPLLLHMHLAPHAVSQQSCRCTEYKQQLLKWGPECPRPLRTHRLGLSRRTGLAPAACGGGPCRSC